MDDIETAPDTAENPDEEHIQGSTSGAQENKATATTKADAEEEPREAEAVCEDDARDTVTDTAVVEPSERQTPEEHPAEKGAESEKSE